ncbi:MAG: DNA glycosylase [Ktedonobacteraceae bacterium]
MQKNGKDVSVTIVDTAIQEIRKVLLVWGKIHYKNYPWRTPEQPWHGLIAEILLQRTKAKNVIPVYETFIKRFPTPERLAQASIEDIQSVMYPLGLRWRTPLLKKLGEHLMQVNNAIPRTYDQLLELPGVGPYVAAAWLSFHGNGRSVIIDANVVRWICRLVDQPMNGETRRKKWLIALAGRLTPEGNSKQYNYAVLDFTMEVCGLIPKCMECPIDANLCLYRRRYII